MSDISLFQNLDETSLENSIGQLKLDEKSRYYTFPFIHDGIECYAYFVNLEDSEDGMNRETLQEALKYEKPVIVIGETPFVMKFGLASETDTERMFAKQQSGMRSGMFITLPNKFKLMIKELSEKVDFDNLFFLAGSDCDEHQRRLSLWYKRITDRISVTDIGFEIFYFDHEVGCYGFKRID